jgi:arylsulfatase A-like enzyme/Flp pilus assembly protein TadD
MAVAALLVTAACSHSSPVPRTRPNILLVTIDTWRADRLGAGISPALDHLSESSMRFTSARAAVPLTLPSHATILTGLLPPAHGLRENGAVLSPAHRTVAAILQSAGYRTAAFVGAYVLDRRFGLAKGFDTYDDRIARDPGATERLEAERPASAVIDSALDWLNHDAPRSPHPAPFFVWIHLYDPHAPYNPPAEFRARTATPYDGEIAYADAQLARVFDRLRTMGIFDRTWILVAGDHGEALGEHGEQTHGMLLYDSTLRVPLIISMPGGVRSRNDEPVSLTDIAPTILHAAGMEPAVAMTGQDLLQQRPQRDLYAESMYPRVAGWSPLQALTDGRWKTIAAGEAIEVYDLRHDPREERNVATAQPSVASAMRTRAAKIAASTAPAQTVSAEAQERLRALGYVSSPVSHAPEANAPNPATRIDEWNAFEQALTVLNDRQPAALGMLERLAKQHPDAPVFETTYARALKEAGRLQQALDVYRAAAVRWPTDAMLLHDLAVAARDAAMDRAGIHAKRLREEAERAERAAIALAPDTATAHNGLGLLAADANRTADAVAAFQRATALDPNNASYWSNLGNARRAAADRAGAERAYRRALDIDARNVDAANGLGVLLVEANHGRDAIPWFTRALDASPDFVEARLNLGIALQQSGQTGRAADVYRKVLAAPPRYKRERDAAAHLLASLR